MDTNRPTEIIRMYWLDLCIEEDAIWLEPEYFYKEAA